MNPVKAANLIENSIPIVFDQKTQQVRSAKWQERIVFFFLPKYKTQQLELIINIVAKKLSTLPRSPEWNDYKKTWDAFFQTYQKDKTTSKILEKNEQSLCRKVDDIAFQHLKNKSLEDKMIRNGQDPHIFRAFPKFVLFLEETGLLSQMKPTRDKIKIIDGEPTILVEGKPMPESELRKNFKWDLAPDYNNEKFVICKKSHEVYTYLDNGLGLQKHHPYISKALTPISTISNEDYEKTLAKAKEFIRPDETEELRTINNAQRDFILQIVSSKTKGPDTNFNNLLIKSKHSYLRVIIGKDNPDLGTKKGDVYEVGFGHFGNFSQFSPLCPKTGKFRSPDIWEYIPCEERIVTNIATTQEETNKLWNFILKYQNNSINLGKHMLFHILNQNCASFVTKAAEIVGVNIKTRIPLSALFCKIAPRKIQALGRTIKELQQGINRIRNSIIQILPGPVKSKIKFSENTLVALAEKVIDAFTALMLLPGNFFLGGLRSDNGDEHFFDEKGNEKKSLSPFGRLKNWFSLSIFD